jgi:hypothetical protein
MLVFFAIRSNFSPFGTFYDHLVYFVVIWYIFGHLVYFICFGMLHQEKSGNPALQHYLVWRRYSLSTKVDEKLGDYNEYVNSTYMQHYFAYIHVCTYVMKCRLAKCQNSNWRQQKVNSTKCPTLTLT